MSNENCELQENIRLRKKLLKLGIGFINAGPRGKKGDKGEKGDKGDTGPKGDQGIPGPVIPSSNEGIFFTGYIDTEESESMTLEDAWLIPNPTEYFILKQREVVVNPGVYEISFSGFIEGVDATHGADLYLKNNNGEALKDLTFHLPAGNISEMHFSKTILFRFDDQTSLIAETSITGDRNTSLVKIEDVTLFLKKIHE